MVRALFMMQVAHQKFEATNRLIYFNTTTNVNLDAFLLNNDKYAAISQTILPNPTCKSNEKTLAATQGGDHEVSYA